MELFTSPSICEWVRGYDCDLPENTLRGFDKFLKSKRDFSESQIKILNLLDIVRLILIRLRFLIFAGLAQLVEHLPCKQRVGGSSPLASSIFAVFLPTFCF